MANIKYIHQATDLLHQVYDKLMDERCNSLAQSYVFAIESGMQAIIIILSLKKDLKDPFSICTMIDLLGVYLSEKISNF